MSRVLITGGTRGIGLAGAKRFIRAGDDVIIAARTVDEADFHDEKVTIIKCDLSDKEAVSRLCREAGDIDVLVNNAGVLTGKAFDSYPEDERDYILRLNLITPVELITHFGSLMAKRGGGRIVNVSSQASLAGNPDIWYGMTKAGLVNCTRSFAGLLGGSGVVINAVSPGPVDTEMVSDSPYGERFDKIRRRTYLGRFAESAEIADVIYWLAKESPVYINGENIVINNGALSLEMS